MTGPTLPAEEGQATAPDDGEKKNTVQIFGCALLLSLSLYFVPGNKQMIINSRFLLGAVCLSLSISLLFLLPTIVTAAAYHV
jgi:hypothetical protein